MSLRPVNGFVIALHEGHESSGDVGVEISVGKLVSGELLEEETIVRLILIKRIDNVVPVAPDFGFFAIALEAIGLGVADEVEPVGGYFFTEVRGVEELVDEVGPGLIGRV